MPIYDYLCSSCGEQTEVIHGIAAPGPRFCPACGAEDTLRKTFAPPAVHFKGSGWAKKDRSSSAKARTKADSGGEAPAGKPGKPGGDGPSPDSRPTASSGSGSGGSSTSSGDPSPSSATPG